MRFATPILAATLCLIAPAAAFAADANPPCPCEHCHCKGKCHCKDHCDCKGPCHDPGTANGTRDDVKPQPTAPKSK